MSQNVPHKSEYTLHCPSRESRSASVVTVHVTMHDSFVEIQLSNVDSIHAALNHVGPTDFLPPHTPDTIKTNLFILV